MEQYIDSQEQWEDSVNADHDKRNERTKEQIDNRVEEYSCTETKPVIMKTYEELKAEASKIGVIAPESPGKAPIPTRQLCKRCMKYSGITFWTPDETWKRVTDDRYQHLCLPCFVDMARPSGVLSNSAGFGSLLSFSVKCWRAMRSLSSLSNCSLMIVCLSLYRLLRPKVRNGLRQGVSKRLRGHLY